MKEKLQDYVNQLYKAYNRYYDNSFNNVEKDLLSMAQYWDGMADSVRITATDLCRLFDLENPFEKENNDDDGNPSEN